MMREYAPKYPLGLIDYAKSLRDNAKLLEVEEERKSLEMLAGKVAMVTI
jgi:hypothetical protein